MARSRDEAAARGLWSACRPGSEPFGPEPERFNGSGGDRRKRIAASKNK